MAEQLNVFQVNKVKMEILERLYASLLEMEKDAATDYRIVGKEDEQATDWRTDELLWEDEEKTIPKYRDKWDHVELTKEELDERPEARAKLAAIIEVKKYLEKLA